MTERPRCSLLRNAQSLLIGPSSMHWDGNALLVQIEEIGCPWPARLRGELRFHPQILSEHVFALDDAGQHQWAPIAPRGRVEVMMQNPALRWSGEAYLDSNRGSAPLEKAFAGWSWSRAALRDGTAVRYDIARRDAVALQLALRFDAAGEALPLEAGTPSRLPRSRWGIERYAHCDPGASATIVRTLVDAPFYSRSILRSRLLDQPVIAVHETLSLDRFASGWVQALLPFRMPRSRR